MSRKCPNCSLVNFSNALNCVRCGAETRETQNFTPTTGFFKTAVARRLAVLVVVLIAVVTGFYLSLIGTSDPLNADERQQVEEAIGLLEQCGFTEEVFYLRHIAAFRSSDNWLNVAAAREEAFAATNFPFGIVTLYSGFFTYPEGVTERAVILLHEARHLSGKGERDAYEFVWKNRKRLGWSETVHHETRLMRSIRKQTAEYSPGLFICDFNPYNDCTY